MINLWKDEIALLEVRYLPVTTCDLVDVSALLFSQKQTFRISTTTSGAERIGKVIVTI